MNNASLIFCNKALDFWVSCLIDVIAYLFKEVLDIRSAPFFGQRLYHTLQNYRTRLLVAINKLVNEFTMHKKFYLMKNNFLPDSTFFLEVVAKAAAKGSL